MAVVSGRGVAGGRGYAGTTSADLASGSSGQGVSQREDLANFISMITRDETPFMSSIGKTKATAIYHEWQTDQLETPGNSRISEGTDYVLPGSSVPLNGGTTPNGGAAIDSSVDTEGGVGPVGSGKFNVIGSHRSRLGNYTQINGKTIAVSGTRRAIDQAGVADEYAYQLKKRGTELRRDVEFDLIHAYSTASATTDQRSFGGYQSWINDPLTVEYNSGASDTGAPAEANRGVGTRVPTLQATQVALSLSAIDSVMQKIYEQGGKANKIMLSPKLRRDFSDLMVTDSGVRRNIDMDGKLRQSVDIYMSDFGDLMVVPNYIMGLDYAQGSVPGAAPMSDSTTNNTKDSCALVYDPMWFAVATLRPLQEVDVGQRGDSTIGMMVEECSFEVKNPLGCGAIYNLS